MAASLCKDAIDSDVYDLYPDYGTIFDESNESNIEVIFDIQYIKNVRVQPWPTIGTSFTEWPMAGIILSAIDAFNVKSTGKPITDPTSGYDEQNPFEDRDPRMEHMYILPNSPFIGGAAYIPAAQDGELQTCFRPRKYTDIDNENRENWFNEAKLSNPDSPATWNFERIKLATRTFDTKKGWLWPIPLEEIQNNNNLTQNTGY